MKADNFAERDCQTCKHVTTTACQHCMSFNMWHPADNLRRDMCASCVNASDVNEGSSWCNDCCFKGIADIPVEAPKADEAQVGPGPDDNYVVVEQPEATEPDTLAEEIAAVQKLMEHMPADGSMKADTGKTPWEYLEWDLLEEVATARAYGIKKYGNPMGWKLVDKAKSRYFAALLRHWRLMNQGEVYDKEAEDLMGMKVTHRGMFLCNAMFIAAFYRDEPDVPMEIVRQ